MDDISQKLKTFIINEFLSVHGKTTLEQDFPLIEEGVIDSLGIFVLINFIEEQFGAKIQPGDIRLDNFENVNTLTNLIKFRMVESA